MEGRRRRREARLPPVLHPQPPPQAVCVGLLSAAPPQPSPQNFRTSSGPTSEVICSGRMGLSPSPYMSPCCRMCATAGGRNGAPRVDGRERQARNVWQATSAGIRSPGMSRCCCWMRADARSPARIASHADGRVGLPKRTERAETRVEQESSGLTRVVGHVDGRV